jgi:hypothetical protein
VIVRINQLDVAHAEQEADWASQGMLGPLWYSWPSDARVFEILIREQDERKHALHEEFRQAQLRMAIPHAIAALREPGEEIVLRLDGPLAPDELLPAFQYLTEHDLTGRFAISPACKPDRSPHEVIASVRIQPSEETCSAICLDTTMGLTRSVRLRAFGLPEELAVTLLEIDETEDQRWREVLPQVTFYLSTTRSLRALQITTRRLSAGELKTRLMQRLLGAARDRQNAGV